MRHNILHILEVFSKIPILLFRRLFYARFVAFFDQTSFEYGLQKAPCMRKKYLKKYENLFFRRLLGSILIIFIFNHCAQVGSLTGGKRDADPPKLLLATPALQTTNFNSGVIVLKFDEFVQVRDLNNQLMISPKLKTKPEIEANGKKIIIKVKKEELLPNTTYRFYFGKAICDMHEANPLTNFSYIFSTGASIDSLKIKGEVISAFQKQKEKDVIVGLYYNKELTDSFPYKYTPDYVTFTDAEGRFEITNLPASDFRLVCFTDKNKDYVYNGADYEQIGFTKEVIRLNSDSSFKLSLFKEVPGKTFIKKVVMNENGKGMLIFNKDTKTTLTSFDENRNSDLFLLNAENSSDTAEFYYRDFKDTIWIKANYGNSQMDTLKLKVPTIKTRNKPTIKISGNISRGSINYFDKPTVVLNHWVDTSRTKLDRIRVMSKSDTVVSKSKVTVTWIGPDRFVINNALKPKTSYYLKVDTGAFKAFNGLVNDSIRIPFQVLKKSDLGSLTLKITFNSKHAYMVQLVNNANNVVKEEQVNFSLSGSNTTSIVFKDLPEDTYRVRIIYDINEDKAWNTGNYLKRAHPEKVYIFEKSIKILPDWEVEEEFMLKE